MTPWAIITIILLVAGSAFTSYACWMDYLIWHYFEPIEAVILGEAILFSLASLAGMYLLFISITGEELRIK